MSNEDTRNEIAAAVSTVAGIKGYPARPRSVKVGDAWPLWRGSERADGQAFIETWAVLIVTPADEVAASQWADGKQDLLIAALRSVLFVESFAPASVPTEAYDLYALMITGRTD